MNPLVQGHSGIAPETSRNAFGTNRGTYEDDSQSVPHPEATIFRSQTTLNSGSEDGQDMVRGAQEKVIYCSPSTSSGKQKKNHSTSQPQFRSENTAATIEGDKILLALQHLANNNNSANFHNKINRKSKCQNRLGQRCPCSTGNLKHLSCLKIFSKRASKFISS